MLGTDVRLKSLEDLLVACKVDYDDQMANWRALDAKAQGAVAIAGLFVGGLLTVINTLPVTAPSLTRWLLAAAILLLLLAVIFALRVLFVRDVADPPGDIAHTTLARDLQTLPDAEAVLPARYLGYLNDRARLWRQTITETRTGNDTKAAALYRAQLSLVGAVGLVGIFAFWRIVTR